MPNNATNISHVHNLATGQTQTFTLNPEEALISAHLLETRRVSQLNDPVVREAVRKLIQQSKSGQSLAIGDLATPSKPAADRDSAPAVTAARPRP